MNLDLPEVTDGAKACTAFRLAGRALNLRSIWSGGLARGIVIGAVIGLSAPSAASAAGGVVYFSGGVLEPTCAMQARAATAGGVSLRLQCQEAAALTRTVDAKNPAQSLNQHVAKASLQAVSNGQSVMLIEYR
ncbi:hypothetical protein [Chromobacterium sphagni]|nr:hypothetical protein [Chromobacterium sphagni]OHX14190.1 hypothetical protein BI347_12235 [Chromobacterium sphagni]